MNPVGFEGGINPGSKLLAQGLLGVSNRGTEEKFQPRSIFA